MFGDVTKIYSSYGDWIASYEYDAWGNITSGSSSGVGAENPFRYRGYYYDNETGFYYLQSRYYDPQICRFISADNLELVPTLSQGAGQLNLYAYCNNNPVMYTDPTGEFAILTAILIGMGIGAAVGLGVGLGLGLSSGASGWDLAGYIAGGVAGGIIAGGIIAASIYAGGAVMNVGYGMLNSGLAEFAGGGTAGGAIALAGAGVMVGVIVKKGVAVGMNVMLATYTPGSWPGDNTSVSPGDGFAWKGKGDVGSNQGNWYNAETGEILHPDLNHPHGIDPHWDYRDIFGKWFRIFKDGRFLPK